MTQNPLHQATMIDKKIEGAQSLDFNSEYELEETWNVSQ